MKKIKMILTAFVAVSFAAAMFAGVASANTHHKLGCHAASTNNC